MIRVKTLIKALFLDITTEHGNAMMSEHMELVVFCAEECQDLRASLGGLMCLNETFCLRKEEDK